MLDWDKYIAVADGFQHKAKREDRDDLNHTIILSLAQALKACGGMVEFKLTSPSSPMLFSANGYQLVVMPMLTAESQSKREQDAEAEPEATETVEQETIEPEATTEATEPETKPAKPKKAKRSRAKEPVAV